MRFKGLFFRKMWKNEEATRSDRLVDIGFQVEILIFTFLDFSAKFMYLLHEKLKKQYHFLQKERILR